MLHEDSGLPPPAADAVAHSARLCAAIAEDIAGNGGWISFARYMDLALYAPGLGYYRAGSAKFGMHGDFVTAPEISPLFGRTLAQQLAALVSTAMPEVLELGAGSGKLARDVLGELASLGKLPARYCILELSGELRDRQKKTLAELGPDILQRVSWLDALPKRFRGTVIANEVLDALPVHVVVWRGDRHQGIFERGVSGTAQDGFAWEERPAAGALLQAAQAIAGAGIMGEGEYLSEISLAGTALIASLADAMEQGVAIFIDYGFPRREYYHSQRAMGTLMCHYRHRAHGDPFHLPGLQDITAHVDFTALSAAASAAGLACLGYATQAQFLINCGITEVLARVPPDDVARYLPLASEAQKLLSPSEMGDLFKVIALGKNAGAALPGFSSGDQRARLE